MAVDWTEIVTAAGAGVTAVAVVYAARQVQLARATWVGQNTRDLWQRWDELSETRRLVDQEGSPENLRSHLESYYQTHDERYYQLLRELNYFEQLGMLVTLKAVAFDDIRQNLASTVVRRWRLWHLAIERLREIEREQGFVRPPREAAYSAFDGLAGRMARELSMPLEGTSSAVSASSGPDARRS